MFTINECNGIEISHVDEVTSQQNVEFQVDMVDEDISEDEVRWNYFFLIKQNFIFFPFITQAIASVTKSVGQT